MKVSYASDGRQTAVSLGTLTGMAICEPEDQFNLARGIAVALLKARSREGLFSRWDPSVTGKFDLDDQAICALLQARESHGAAKRGLGSRGDLGKVRWDLARSRLENHILRCAARTGRPGEPYIG